MLSHPATLVLIAGLMLLTISALIMLESPTEDIPHA
jgi:hypothetical protein